jgi:hypothetical protein
MRQCPTCNRSYGDETLTYCLADGSLLSDQYDSEATQRIPPPRETSKPTEILNSMSSTAQSTRRSSTPLHVYAVIGLLALIAGGTIVTLIKWDSKSPSAAKTESSVNAPSPAAKQDDLEEEKARLEREKEQLALEKESQRLAEERKELEEQKREAASSNTRQVAIPPSGTWFVFFGAFTKDEYYKAEERLQIVRRAGYDANIIDTDNYPNLSSGLWAVVSGPYSKPYAENLAAKAKSVRSDAYIKSGW